VFNMCCSELSTWTPRSTSTLKNSGCKAWTWSHQSWLASGPSKNKVRTAFMFVEIWKM
jgi:hypothetical protein